MMEKFTVVDTMLNSSSHAAQHVMRYGILQFNHTYKLKKHMLLAQLSNLGFEDF